MSKILPFESDLRRSAFICSLMLFSIICSFVILKAARDALFLSHYSARSLPYIMALNTLISAGAAALYLRLHRRYQLKRLVLSFFALFVFGILLLWLHTGHNHHLLAGMLYIWGGIIGTLAPVQAWSLIAKQFSTREAKSVMGVMGGGATLGGILGGAGAALVVKLSQNVYLLIPVAGAILILAFFCALFLSESRFEEAPPIAANNERQVQRRFVILLLAVVALGTIVSTFIDFQFKTLSQYHFKSSENMASFFGTFYATAGVIALFLQFVGIPFFMRSFRISTSLPMLPGSLFVINGIFFLTGAFTAAIALRGVEEVLKHSVERSSLEVIYVALPENAKVRLKGWVDTIGVRVPEGIAALLLVLLFTQMHLPIQLIVFLNTGFLFAWLACAYYFGRKEYPMMLRREIRQQDLDFETVKENLFTNQFYHFLPELFRTLEKETILSLLDLLETSGKRWLGRYLVVTLKDEDPEVRLKSLRLLFDQNANLSYDVQGLLQDKDDRIRAEAVHYLRIHGRSKDEIVQKLGEDRELSIRVALNAPKKGILSDEECGRLEELLRESLTENRPDAREEIAHVLRYARATEHTIPLYKKLVVDQDRDVRTTIVRAIARTRPAGLISRLLNASRDPAIHEEVVTALSAYGKDLLPNLTTLIVHPKEKLSRKKLALKLAANVGGSRALELILRAAKNENLAVRFAAMKALTRLKDAASLPRAFPAINKLLNRELKALERESQRSKAISSRPESIMYRLVSQRISWAFQRVFLLLSVLNNSSALMDAYLGWKDPDPKRKDAALELVEQTISLDLRQRILPLMEQFTSGHSEDLNREEVYRAIRSYLNEKEPVLVAAAIWDMEDPRELLKSTMRDKLARNSHPLIQEAYRWRKANMESSTATVEEKAAINTIQKMEILSKIDVFSKLGSQELLLLADQAVEVRFEPEQIIFNEGDIAGEFICIVSGKVELTRSTKTVEYAGPGESIGVHEVLTNQARLFTATALEHCICLSISRNTFWDILEDYTSVCHGVIEVLVQQIDTLADRLARKSSRRK